MACCLQACQWQARLSKQPMDQKSVGDDRVSADGEQRHAEYEDERRRRAEDEGGQQIVMPCLDPPLLPPALAQQSAEEVSNLGERFRVHGVTERGKIVAALGQQIECGVHCAFDGAFVFGDS